MQSTLFYASYQQRLQRMLYRVATLACLLLGGVTLLFALPTSDQTRLLFGMLCLAAGGVVWQCGRWLQQARRPQFAMRLSISTLLTLATYVTAIAPTPLPGTGVFAYLLVLQFSARIDERRMAWVWCTASSMLYVAATLLRRWLLGSLLLDDLWLGVATYIIPCCFFFFYTLISLDVTRHLRETEEKGLHLQQDLLDRTWEYHQLLQSMNEGFVVVDENEVFRYVNDRFCEMLGLQAEKVLGHRNQDVIQYDETNLAILRKETARRAQKLHSSYELQATRPDGVTVTLLVSAVPNLDSNGNYRGAFCVVTDITQRKAAEEALKAERALLSQRVEERTASLSAANAALLHELAQRRQAEADYRLLFDNLPIGSYRSSLDGRLLRANPALLEFSGYASEAEMLSSLSAITKDWYVDPQRRLEFTEILEKQGSVANFESEIYCCKTKERIWISETAVLVRDQDGHPLYYQGTVEDITARKRVELQQQQLIIELARVAQMKDEFLANISHELRTPLNAILSITEVLREQIYGPLTARQTQALDTIESSGRHLLSLINGILDLAKMEAGQLELAPKAVDVNALCQASIKLVQTAAQKKHLHLSFTPDPAVHILVVDELRLKQILINLLGNAVKFTPEGGAIGLKVIGQAGEQPTVQFVVWDTGVGIPQAAIKDLFKPFVQIDSRLARRHEGTGLGLALVQSLAALHGGDVTVESEVERGSRFTVTLPWRKPAVNEGDKPSSQSKTQQPAPAHSRFVENGAKPGTRILVLADDPAAAQMMADYLIFKEYQVQVVETPGQRFASVATAQPALVIIDLQLPAADQATLASRLLADAGFQLVPIIVLTNGALPTPEPSPQQEGKQVYLTKPVGLQQLVATVEHQLDQ